MLRQAKQTPLIVMVVESLITSLNYVTMPVSRPVYRPSGSYGGPLSQSREAGKARKPMSRLRFEELGDQEIFDLLPA